MHTEGRIAPLPLNETSSFSHTEFILFGFPGVTKLRPLLILPFFSVYTVIITGNSAVMTIIVLEKSLHTPMYTLIFSQLAVNVLHHTAITPKMILSMVGLNQISLSGCLMQLFTVYSSISTETVLLLLMALDRYLAISRPLQYSQIITTQLLVHFSVNALLRICFLVFPLLGVVATLQYCRSNVIYHFHCENAMLLNLGCDVMSINKLILFFLRTGISLFDISCISISYLKVLHTVMTIAVGAARHKAMHTCSTHLLVVALFYITGLLSVIMNLFDASVSYNVQNISGAINFLLPFSLNPFIYGLRMKGIRQGFLKHWRRQKPGCLTHNGRG